LASASTVKATYAVGAFTTFGDITWIESDDGVFTKVLFHQVDVELKKTERFGEVITVSTLVLFTVASQMREVVSTMKT
jgi:hypothetical protein